MIKAVIFDLDGTLLYTLEDLTDSVNFALSRFGERKRSVDEIRSFVGNGVSRLIARALNGGEENPFFEPCLSCFKEHYKQNMYNKTKPYDGILEVLEKLEKSGVKTAVVSNKFDAAVKELCKVYFSGHFVIALGESEKIRKKPAPDGIFLVMKELGVDKDSAVYVGDSEVDIQTAANAQIPCISVDWGYKDRTFLEQSGAKKIISAPQSLLEII